MLFLTHQLLVLDSKPCALTLKPLLLPVNSKIIYVNIMLVIKMIDDSWISQLTVFVFVLVVSCTFNTLDEYKNAVSRTKLL